MKSRSEIRTVSGTFWEICCYISNSSFCLPTLTYVWGGNDFINVSLLKVHLLWSILRRSIRKTAVLKKAETSPPLSDTSSRRK